MFVDIDTDQYQILPEMQAHDFCNVFLFGSDFFFLEPMSTVQVTIILLQLKILLELMFL